MIKVPYAAGGQPYIYHKGDLYLGNPGNEHYHLLADLKDQGVNIQALYKKGTWGRVEPGIGHYSIYDSYRRHPDEEIDAAIQQRFPKYAGWPFKSEPEADPNGITEVVHDKPYFGHTSGGEDWPFIYDMKNKIVHVTKNPSANHWQLMNSISEDNHPFPYESISGERLNPYIEDPNILDRLLLRHHTKQRINWYNTPTPEILDWVNRKWPNNTNMGLSHVAHEFLPENEDYMHHDGTVYRWVLDDLGEVHFGLGDDYSHWDIMRKMNSQGQPDYFGYYRPAQRKVSVQEDESGVHTTDPSIFTKVQDAFDNLVMHESNVKESGPFRLRERYRLHQQSDFTPEDQSAYGINEQKWSASDRGMSHSGGDLPFIYDHDTNTVHYTDGPAHHNELAWAIYNKTQTMPNKYTAGEKIGNHLKFYSGYGGYGYIPQGLIDWAHDVYKPKHSLLQRSSANGWRKWIYDPESGDYQEWEGTQPHPLVAQTVWPNKDLSTGNWWGGSRYIGSSDAVPKDYHAEVYYCPPEYDKNYGKMVGFGVPDFITQHFSKTSADNYFYIRSWMRPMTRFIYFPTYHILFARPWMDSFYMTHMDMLKVIFQEYPNLVDEPLDGGYVTQTGQVNVTMPAMQHGGLEQALRAYNLENQSTPLPH